MSKKNVMLNMMNQLQENLQGDIAAIRVTASSGGGMVIAEMDGTKRLLSLKIDPEIVKSGDIEMLQDLIIAAVNEAARQTDEQSNAKMQSYLGRIKIPGLF